MWKYAIASFGVGVLIVAALLVDASPAKPKPGAISLAASTSTPTSAIYASGRVEGASQEIHLRNSLPGSVVEILVSEGDQVQRDQVLLRGEDLHYLREIDRTRAHVELAEAELQKIAQGPTLQQLQEVRAQYQAREAQLAREQATWRRLEELLATGTITAQESDDQRARLDAAIAEAAAAKARLDDLESRPRPEDLKIAHAEVATAQASLHLAEANFRRTQLHSPIDGQVLQVAARVGEMVGPESQQPAIILADTSRFRVRAFVDEIDAPGVEIGMPAVITADGLHGQQIHGRVARLGHRMEAKVLHGSRPTERYDTKTREVWIDVEASDAPLIVGLRVDVYIDPAP